MAFLILPKTSSYLQSVLNTACIESVQLYYHDKTNTGVITIVSTAGGDPIKYTFQEKREEYEALKQRILSALEAIELPS